VADEVLRLEGIGKSYAIGTSAETAVLHDIDLVLAGGGFYALMGPVRALYSTLSVCSIVRVAAHFSLPEETPTHWTMAR
jgi:ABC-type uncharacterized transport system YnjBCD ATPase subunit